MKLYVEKLPEELRDEKQCITQLIFEKENPDERLEVHLTKEHTEGLIFLFQKILELEQKKPGTSPG